MQPRDGVGGRRLFMPSGADRLMLLGINANLEHLRRPTKSSAQSPANGDPGLIKSEAVIPNGAPAKGANGRLDYNRQALHEIGQSLKDYHIDASPPQMMSGINGCNETDNLIRQLMLLGYDEEVARRGITLCSSKNIEKVLEVINSLCKQEAKNGVCSRLGVPGYSKVIRKPSFEEKYRTTSPSTLSNIHSNFSSDLPLINGTVQQCFELNINHHSHQNPAMRINSGGRHVFGESGQEVDPFTCPTSRNTTFCNQGHEYASETAAMQNRYPRPVLRLVPGGTVGSRNGSPGTVASGSSGSSPQAILPPVRQMTHAYVPNLGSALSHNFISDFVNHASEEASPLSSHSPSPASTPSSGYGQNAAECHNAPVFARSSQATVLNTRQNFSKHLCSSKEVEKPIAQKATAPSNPHILTSAVQDRRSKAEFLMTKMPSLCQMPSREMPSEPGITVNGAFILPQDQQQNFTLVDSHRVAPAPVFYKQPFTQQKLMDIALYNGQHDDSVAKSNPQSEYLVSSTFTVKPLVVDVPERPPPPYPGREIDIRFVAAPHEMNPYGRTYIQISNGCNVNVCTDAMDNAVDCASCEQYADSIDGSSQTDADGVIVEKQLIESPKPIRKAEACIKDAERSETRVRRYPPQAYRFYMEQHMENIFKFRKERLERQMQLEKEMSQVNLPPETQAEIRKMLIQKESNYLRQRRAKIDRSMFERLKTLGTGAFGQVDLVLKRDTNKLYALKTLQKKDVLKRNQVAHVKAERDILAEADNEWVVKLYYSFQDSANLYIVMDYIPGGDLMGLLIKFGIFKEDLAQFYIAELVLAIESVHAMGFIHRDIKPDNILIGKDGHIKLTDFGLCTGFRWTHSSEYYQEGNHARQDSMEPNENWGQENCQCKKEILKPMERRRQKHQRCLAHSLVGTPNYIAPEVLCKSGYTACCDWWSVGVILYEMRVGQPPFLAQNPAETQMKVIDWRNTLKIPSEANLTSETSNVISKLCCGPEERLGKNGSTEVKSHPFFQGICFESLRQQEAPYVPHLRHPTDTSNFDPVDPTKLRRNSSRDSLVKEETYEGGKHAFLEFTFRRFFDDDGHAHATRMHDPETDTGIFV